MQYQGITLNLTGNNFIPVTEKEVSQCGLGPSTILPNFEPPLNYSLFSYEDVN